MKKGDDVEIAREQRVDFLRRVREARSLILRDSESFHLAVCVIEHIGQSLANAVRTGFKHYQAEILNLIAQETSHGWDETLPLYELVGQARNDSVHGGAYIRHHTMKLNQLLLMLDEALMSDLQTAKDLMVNSPVVVEHWQQLAEVRRQMLSNSFSYIPIIGLSDRPNAVVSEIAMARVLSGNRSERNRLLALRVCEALEEPEEKRLGIEDAPECVPDSTREEFLKTASHKPTLVKSNGRLVGIITAFDLL